MHAETKTKITVAATINAPIATVWAAWNEPSQIIKWNNASPDWHTPTATNDLREGGRFNYRMEARDGSMGFDFGGKYDKIEANKTIRYTLDDGRKVETHFNEANAKTTVETTFEAEDENSVELQRNGWQGILDSFKNHLENNF